MKFIEFGDPEIASLYTAAVVRVIGCSRWTGIGMDALQDTARIGVSYENRPIERVQQYRIGRFRTDTLYGQKSGSQAFRRLVTELAKAAASLDMAGERLQAAGLYTVGAGAANQLTQEFGTGPANGLRTKQAVVVKSIHRARSLGPGRVLHQNCARHDAERTVGRPPALWSIMIEQ
jgi:hypothetical protein